MTSFDVTIVGGTVIDGTGGPSFVADVGIKHGRIAAVGDLTAASSAVELDARTLTVTPGLVDTHSHADVAVYLPAQEPFAASVAPLLQGVTTEVCGNCGLSPFPVREHEREHVGPVLSSAFGDGAPTFASFADYRAELTSRGLPTNLAPLVGHGTLRAGVMGLDGRDATAPELAEMQRRLADALEQGAHGLSSGLIYAPGIYADTAELQSLVAVCARFGRPYTTHMRSETDAVVEAMDEAMSIVGDTAALHISHHKVAGRRNFGRSDETLSWIARQHSAGLDVSLDAYPYTAGSTTMLALLPPEANAGPLPERLARLADSSVRDRIRDAIRNGLPGWENLVGAAGWDGVVIAGAPTRPEIEGARLTDLAGGRDPVDVMCELLRLERGRVTIVVHMMDQPDVDAIMTSPLAMVGSDGVPLPGRPHPRLTGTFARVLGSLTRERGLLSATDAVRRMTSLPAQRFGLAGRGVVAQGAVADLAVFDMDRVAETGTFESPWRRPDGVHHVLVAGEVCVRSGTDTGRRAGSVLIA